MVVLRWAALNLAGTPQAVWNTRYRLPLLVPRYLYCLPPTVEGDGSGNFDASTVPMTLQTSLRLVLFSCCTS